MEALNHWNWQCEDSDINDEIRVPAGCQESSEVDSHMILSQGTSKRIASKHRALELISSISRIWSLTHNEECQEPCDADPDHDVNNQAKLDNAKGPAVEEQDGNFHKTKSCN